MIFSVYLPLNIQTHTKSCVLSDFKMHQYYFKQSEKLPFPKSYLYLFGLIIKIIFSGHVCIECVHYVKMALWLFEQNYNFFKCILVAVLAWWVIA